jgi:hypothetical protein
MPKMTPFGDVGKGRIRAYAARRGQTEEAFVKQMGEPLTPEIAGAAILGLVETDPAATAGVQLDIPSAAPPETVRTWPVM